jgi:hypothetical protein
MGLSYPNVRNMEDQSPQTIAWHLAHHHEKVVSVNSIHRHLRGAGHVIAVPYKRLRPPPSALLPSFPTNVGRAPSRTAGSPASLRAQQIYRHSRGSFGEAQVIASS